MVIVTCQGDMHLYPASVAETFQYDAEQDIYTLVSDGQTVSFGGQDIKQIRFADKTETAQDPLLTPKETDKYNPNFEHPEVDSYEILLMDTALCHAQVQFKEDVPQLYVGKILSLENDTAAYNWEEGRHTFPLCQHRGVDLQYRICTGSKSRQYLFRNQERQR